MDTLLSQIKSPLDLKKLSPEQLESLAIEMRDALCGLVASRTAHFASNLGVVELCLALHTEFDFRSDRLIWDTGHGFEPAEREVLTLATLIGSIALTLILWVVGYLAMGGPR